MGFLKPEEKIRLTEKYKKLKDKEIRLEGDLAMREHPEFEDAIRELLIAFSECKKADRAVKLVSRPQQTPEMLAQLEQRKKFYIDKIEAMSAYDNDTARKQVQFYKGRLAELNSVSDLTTGESSYDALIKKRKDAVDVLRAIYEKHADTLKDGSFDMPSLLPSICDFVDV